MKQTCAECESPSTHPCHKCQIPLCASHAWLYVDESNEFITRGSRPECKECAGVKGQYDALLGRRVRVSKRVLIHNNEYFDAAGTVDQTRDDPYGECILVTFPGTELPDEWFHLAELEFPTTPTIEDMLADSEGISLVKAIHDRNGGCSGSP